MASAVFINQINEMLREYLVSGVASIRVKLCMSNCDAAAAALLATARLAGVTIDECDATGYTEQSLTTPASYLNVPSERAEFYDIGAIQVAFTGLSGDATRDYTGILLYIYVDGNPSNDIPVAWIEFSVPVVKESTNVTVAWNAEGIIQAANA